jgi:hypothetical protein
VHHRHKTGCADCNGIIINNIKLKAADEFAAFFLVCPAEGFAKDYKDYKDYKVCKVFKDFIVLKDLTDLFGRLPLTGF